MRLDAPHKWSNNPREKRMRVNCSLSASQWSQVWTWRPYYNDHRWEDLDFLNRINDQKETSEELPFNGGAIGFVGYDLISPYEDIGSILLKIRSAPKRSPLFLYIYVIFDHKKEKVYVVKRTSIVEISGGEVSKRAWSKY